MSRHFHGTANPGGHPGQRQHAVLLKAAAAIWLTGPAPDQAAGAARARQAIESGGALRKLIARTAQA